MTKDSDEGLELAKYFDGAPLAPAVIVAKKKAVEALESKKPKSDLPAEDDLLEVVNGTVLKLRNMDGGYRSFNIANVLMIDDQNISADFASQASVYGYFAALLAMAEDAAAGAVVAREQQEASSSLYWRTDAQNNGSKITEGNIQAMVTADEDVQKAVDRELKTKLDAKLLKSIVGALEQRANMLVSMGAMMRHEMDMTSMRINQSKFDETVEEVKQLLTARKSK